MILNPLQRIRVLESTKKCKAGSLGYFVAQDSVNSYNGWDMCIVFTRFGKKGKLRSEPVIVRPYMIEYDTMKESDQYILSIAATPEGIEPRLYPDKRGRVAGKLGDTKLEPAPSDVKDLLNVSDEEFIAYIMAMSLLLHKIVRGKRVNMLTRQFTLKAQKFVNSGFDISTLHPEILAHYILYGMGYDAKKYNRYVPEGERIYFSKSLASQISNPAKKRIILNKLRKSMAMTKTALDKHHKYIEKSFQNNSARINDVIKYYRRRKRELESLKEQAKKKELGWYASIHD